MIVSSIVIYELITLKKGEIVKYRLRFNFKKFNCFSFTLFMNYEKKKKY